MQMLRVLMPMQRVETAVPVVEAAVEAARSMATSMVDRRKSILAMLLRNPWVVPAAIRLM
jgi:uncharacterized membrane protein